MYDADTGKFKYNRKFSFTLNFDTISTKINDIFYHFRNIENKFEFSLHSIKKVTYKVYNYNRDLLFKKQINANGNLRLIDFVSQDTSEFYDLESVTSIFNDLSFLDLDNFFESGPLYLTSHAPCYCLEIQYDNSKNVKYCRQRFNKFMGSIVNEINGLNR